jgi:hypothetical protein
MLLKIVLKVTSLSAIPLSVLVTNGTMAHVSSVAPKLAITAQFLYELKISVFPVIYLALIVQFFA